MKNLQLIITLCVASLTCAVSVRATDVVQIGSLYYILDATQATATFTNRPISEEYNPDSWMYYQPNELYSGHLIIPDSVSYNGHIYAVTSVGDYAMANCRLLQSIHLPKGLQSIGTSAFALCYNVASISIAPSSSVYSVIDGILYERQPMRIRFVPYALSGSVSIDPGVTEIYSECFKLCTRITSITLPDHLTTIGDGAFNECSGLQSIHLPSSLQTIQRYAFFKCSSLREIALPSTLQTIEASAFLNCTQLQTVYNASSLNIVAGSDTHGHVAFYATQVIQGTPTNLKEVSIGESTRKYILDGQLIVEKAGVRYNTLGQKL